MKKARTSKVLVLYSLFIHKQIGIASVFAVFAYDQAVVIRDDTEAPLAVLAYHIEDEFYRRTFSRAVFADQSHDTAARQGEIEIIEQKAVI